MTDTSAWLDVIIDLASRQFLSAPFLQTSGDIQVGLLSHADHWLVVLFTFDVTTVMVEV